MYDVIQQVFNGPMERGYNRVLAIDVFRTGRITEQIVAGQKRSEETQKTKNMRLGYMGHLTLIAEELVKFSENLPPEMLTDIVMKDVLNEEWVRYVEQTLSETRERDNAILGGIRPEMTLGQRQTSIGGSQGFGDSSLNGDFGSGFQGFEMAGQGSASSGVFNLGGPGNALLSGFGSSSDEEDEELEEFEDRADPESETVAKGNAETETENVGDDDFFTEIDLHDA